MVDVGVFMSPKYLKRAVATAAALLPVLAGAAPLTLEQALELATQRSQAARSAGAGLVSAAEAARAAGQLPDPVLRAGGASVVRQHAQATADREQLGNVALTRPLQHAVLLVGLAEAKARQGAAGR